MNKITAADVFQPGEASWASWKCEGGVHTSELLSPVAPEPNKTTETCGRIAVCAALPYGGTETNVLDLPAIVTVPTGFWADMPA